MTPIILARDSLTLSDVIALLGGTHEKTGRGYNHITRIPGREAFIGSAHATTEWLTSSGLVEWDDGPPDSWHLEPGYSLDFLRILTGPVCRSHWDCDGRIMVDDDDHQSDHAERAYESQCADYYGGSGGLSDREREERGRDSGRGTW